MPQWKMDAVIAAGLVTLAIIAAQTIPKSQPANGAAAENKVAVQNLLKKEEALNDRCRGGSGDDPQTEHACVERDKLVSVLEAKGWCYGTEDQSEYQKVWQLCSANLEKQDSQKKNSIATSTETQFPDLNGAGDLHCAYMRPCSPDEYRASVIPELKKMWSKAPNWVRRRCVSSLTASELLDCYTKTAMEFLAANPNTRAPWISAVSQH